MRRFAHLHWAEIYHPLLWRARESRESIDYVLTQRLEPVKPVDPIWLKAKEDEIAESDRKLQFR